RRGGRARRAVRLAGRAARARSCAGACHRVLHLVQRVPDAGVRCRGGRHAAAMTRVRALAALIALVAGVGLAAWDGGGSPLPGRPGSRAPQLAGTTLDGAHVDLTSYRGKPALVLFGASYCEPCRKEWPDVAATARQHPELAIIGVSYEDSRSIMR